MDGATLRLLETLRTASFAARPPRSALEAFTCLLHGSATPALSGSERIWLETVSRQAEAEGWPRAAVFAAIYQDDMAAEKVGERVSGGGGLAIEGLLALPRAERAALALSCVLGFTDGEVAVVLGLQPAAAAATIEQAVELVRAASTGERRARRSDGAAA